jgi:Ca-activated chloride channel homolog
MNFAAPVWLYIGLVVCLLLAAFFWWSDRRRRLALQTLISKHLLEELTANFSPLRRLIKRILFIAALACFFIALARPQYGYRWQEVKRKGIDLVVAVDVSRSMLTEDVKPNRLERAKLAIHDLTDLLDGDRLALVPFAGSAYVMCPPTLDYSMFLDSLDTLSPDMMPLPGTDIATAIQASADLLGKAQGSRKILILITDGEDLEGSALAVAKQAAAQGIVIYTVGIGTPAGDLIPVPNAGGGVDFLKDENGKIVKSRLDEDMLRKIAAATGGVYALQSSRSDGLEKIYNEKIQNLPKQELSSRMEKIPLERFIWSLIAGMLLLVAELLTRERKMQLFSRNRKTLTTTAVALVLGVLSLPLIAKADVTPDAKDQQEYGKVAEQLGSKLSKDPNDPQLNYNYGTANYKLGHYDVAATSLQKALQADDLKLQNQAYYNYGNTLYRRGEVTEKSQPDNTRNLWKQSIQAYQGALKLNEQDKEAKDNLEFVTKRLNELPPPQQSQDNQDQKNQQQQQQQQNQQQNQQNQDQQQKDSKDKNNQSQQKQPQDKQQNSPNQQNNPNQQNQNQPKPDANQQPNQGKDQNQKQNQPKPDANGQQQKQPSGQGNGNGMTPEQAKAALDSLKGEEHPYTAAMPNYKSQPSSANEVKKDW